MIEHEADPDKIEISFRCLKATQPIGDLYVAMVSHKDLIRITYFDVRRVLSTDRGFESYLGIQRPIEPKRLDDLEAYVNYADATFPTSIIIAIDSEYAEFDENSSKLTVRNYQIGDERPTIAIRNIARVLDGQHRIEGLKNFDGQTFELSVSIFVGADIADQAQIFSIVNLEQTKVRKSLVYDLYELSKIRSPQQVGHKCAVILDGDEDSAMYQRIKRLGVATEQGRFEPITQATFVESILPYFSLRPKADRDVLLRGGKIENYENEKDRQKSVLRPIFAQGRDLDIAKVFFNYFNAIQKRWPKAWKSKTQGMMLNRTNGIRAFLRYFGIIYSDIAAPGNVPSMDKFFEKLEDVKIKQEQFSTRYFAPGTSGEAKLLRVLKGEEDLALIDPSDQTPDPEL